MGDAIRMVPPEGGAAVEVPAEHVQVFTDRGYTQQDNTARAAAVVGEAREDYYNRPDQIAKATLAAGARGITGGLSDAVIRTVGGDDARRELEALREYNPTLSTVTEIAGSLTPIGAGGLAGRLGARIAGSGGGALAQVARAGVRGAVEGGIMGAGQGVTELALSDDPLTAERIASVIGSNAVLGGVTGGAIGATGKGIGLGLRRAKAKLDDIAARPRPGADPATDDLAQLDPKGLRAARKAEVDRLEAARVPERAQVADEIRSFRAELKQSKLWLATKGADDAEVRAIGRRTLKADRALDNLLDDPKALAENPKGALRQLRVQEAALDDLVNKHSEKLRAKFGTDTSGDRVKALDFASTALEKNRALQARIDGLASPSARLTAIDDALAGRLAPQAAAGGIGDVVGDAALGYAVGAAAGIPGLGAIVGAARVAMPVLKKIGANSTAVATRASKAIGLFLNAGAKVGPRAPIIASRTLASVRFSDSPEEKRAKRKGQKSPALAESYRARSRELRELTAPGPDGAPIMRMDARQKIADRIAPIRAASPLLADRIETTKARAIEFLASKLPRKPALPGMSLAADTWQPSDMEMRGWARLVAAVEDPTGVVERLASGEVTPEDAEAMREVYPEIYADIQAQIMMQIGELRARLPYRRRLALSIFSGVPVDPVLDPRVLAAVQASYAIEEGSEGGSVAPRPQPQFGSVSKEKPTPAQERAG